MAGARRARTIRIRSAETPQLVKSQMVNGNGSVVNLRSSIVPSFFSPSTDSPSIYYRTNGGSVFNSSIVHTAASDPFPRVRSQFAQMNQSHDIYPQYKSDVRANGK